MIFAREDIPPPRTHAPVAQPDRVSDSDSEGHRFDSCRVYHNSRRVTRREFLLTRAGVLPFADAVCAAANSPAHLLFSPLSPAIPSSLRFVLTTPAGCTTTPAVLHGGSFCSLGQESYRSLTRFARRLLFFPHHIPLIHGTATNSPALLSLSPLSPAIPSSLRFVLTTPAGCTTPE